MSFCWAASGVADASISASTSICCRSKATLGRCAQVSNDVRQSWNRTLPNPPVGPWANRNVSSAASSRRGIRGSAASGANRKLGMNLPSSPMLMWTVPSSRGSSPISRATVSKKVSFSTPLAAMTSHRRGDDALAFAGDFRLGERAVEQVATVVGGSAAHVVRRAAAHQPHRDQSQVGIGEQPSHVAEVGDERPVQVAIGRVGDRLVHGVGAHADRTPAQVVFADVDGVQGGVERVRAAVQQVGLGDRVVLQRVIGDVVLRIHHVLDQVVAVVLGVGGKEHVSRRSSSILPKVETMRATLALPM